MESDASAQEAIKELNGTQLAGDAITVELAKSEVDGGGGSGGMRRPSSSSSYRRYENDRYPDSDRPRPYRGGEPYGGRGDRFESRDRFEGPPRGKYEYAPRDRFDSRGIGSGHYADDREHSRRGGLPPPPTSSGSSSYDSTPSGNLRMDREMRAPPPHARSDDYYPPPPGVDFRGGDNYRRRGYSPNGSNAGYERPPPTGQSIRYEDDRFDYPRSGGGGPYGNRSNDFNQSVAPSPRHQSEYPRREEQ